MPNPLVIGGISAASSVINSRRQSRAVSQASAADQAATRESIAAQEQAANRGIEEQRRQFDSIQKLLSPFVQGGGSAFAQQLMLTGVNGPQAQQQAINQLQGSPEMRARIQAGENAILQNASATGGLRGGNTQAALAQFRPQMLADMINQQYARLGGLSTMGQNAAAGVGTAGQNMAANVTGLYGQIGQAQAGGAERLGTIGRAGAMGQANAFGQGISGLARSLGYAGSFERPEGEAGGLFKPWGFEKDVAANGTN